MKNRLLKLVGEVDRHFKFRMVRLHEKHWFHRLGCDYAAGEGQGPERSYHAIVVTPTFYITLSRESEILAHLKTRAEWKRM